VTPDVVSERRREGLVVRQGCPSRGARTLRAMVPVTLDDVRALALSLPRSYEAVVRADACAK
jgi:hypothetical protein